MDEQNPEGAGWNNGCRSEGRSREDLLNEIRALGHAISDDGTWEPDEPEEPEEELSPEELAELYEYRRNLLRRLGFEGDFTTPDWWAAARSVGFSLEQFYTLSLDSLCAVLEAKAAAIDQLTSEAEPLDDDFEVVKYAANIRGGRPSAIVVDAVQIKLLRKETNLNQESMARACNISLPTFQRAEAGRASLETLTAIARGLSVELQNRKITARDLMK